MRVGIRRRGLRASFSLRELHYHLLGLWFLFASQRERHRDKETKREHDEHSALSFFSSRLLVSVQAAAYCARAMSTGTLTRAALLGLLLGLLSVCSTEAAGNAEVFDIGSELDPFLYTIVSV